MTGVLVDVTCPPPSMEGAELATLTNFPGHIGGTFGGVTSGLNPALQQAEVQNFLIQFAKQQTDKDEAKR